MTTRLVMWGVDPVTLGATLRAFHLHIEEIHRCEVTVIHDKTTTWDMFVSRFEYLQQFLAPLGQYVVNEGHSWRYLEGLIPVDALLFASVEAISKQRRVLLTDGRVIEYDYLITGNYLPLVAQRCGLNVPELSFEKGSRFEKYINTISPGDYEIHDGSLILRRGHCEVTWNFGEEIPYSDAYISPQSSELSERLVERIEEEFAVLARGRFGGWCQALPDEEFMQGVESADFALAGQGEQLLFDRTEQRPFSHRHLALTRWFEGETEFVVANYNETFEWTAYVPGSLIIYHKGFEDPPAEFRGTWTTLDNVGMEAHTYLTHIVSHYHELAPVTAFFLGKLKRYQERGWIFEDLVQYRRALERGLAVRRTADCTAWDIVTDDSEGRGIVIEDNVVAPSMHGDSLGEYWRLIFGEEHPPSVKYSEIPVFAVRRDVIHRRTRQFYQRLLDTVKHETRPQEAYFLRMMWLTIFDPG